MIDEAMIRPFAAAVFGLISLVVVSCDPYSGLPAQALGVRQESQDSSVVIEYAYCPGETLERVQLVEVVGSDPAIGDDDDRVLWEIVANDSARQRPPSIKLGVVPHSFDEMIPLAKPLESDAPYAVLVDTNDFRGIIAIEFRLGELETDRILSGGRHLSEEEFAKRGKMKCRDVNPGSASAAATAAAYGVPNGRADV